MKLKSFIFTLLPLFLSTTLCGSAPKIISRNDQGKTFTLPPDTRFYVELEANPSTGFNWEILHIDSCIIEVGKRTFHAVDSTPGSAGIDEINFRTLKKGTSLLKLGYLRTFEGLSSMTDSFKVVIQVR